MALDQTPTTDLAAAKNAEQANDAYAAALAHRSTLARLAEQSQSDYDKAVMTLSGGALGISFGYVKEVAGNPPYAHWGILLAAWSAWTVSVAACLFSLSISGVALRKEIDKIDDELLRPEADDGQRAKGGRAWDKATNLLNLAGGILFAVGAAAMIGFVISSQYAQPPSRTPGPNSQRLNRSNQHPGPV